MTLNNGEEPIHLTGRWICLLLAFFVFCWINVFWPLIRFSVPSMNGLFFAGVQTIPWVVAITAFQWKGWRRWGLFGPMILFAIACLPIGLLSVACSVSDDNSFERVLSVPTAKGTVVVYRSNGDALTRDAITVRQQCALLPGLLVVQDLEKWGPVYGDQVSVTAVDPSHVRIMIEDSGGLVAYLVPLPCLWSRSG